MEDPFNQFHCSIAPRPPAAVSEDGSYKIDADPDAFSVILTWLRRRRLLLKTDTSLESVLVEAEFFGLEELKELVEVLIKEKKSSEDKEAIEKQREARQRKEEKVMKDEKDMYEKYDKRNKEEEDRREKRRESSRRDEDRQEKRDLLVAIKDVSTVLREIKSGIPKRTW